MNIYIVAIIDQNFENDNKFGRDLIFKIDSHYTHLWRNERNTIMKKYKSHFIAFPKTLRIKLMNYLWEDIFHKFSNFFLYNSENMKKNTFSR